MLYGHALKETMIKGQNVSNGTQVAMNFRSQYFRGDSEDDKSFLKAKYKKKLYFAKLPEKLKYLKYLLNIKYL